MPVSFGPHLRMARPTALLAPVTTTFMANPDFTRRRETRESSDSPEFSAEDIFCAWPGASLPAQPHRQRATGCDYKFGRQFLDARLDYASRYHSSREWCLREKQRPGRAGC